MDGPVSQRNYWVLLQAGVAMAAIRVLARVATLPRVLGWLHRDLAKASPDRVLLDEWAYYTDRWLTLCPANAKGNCFPRSLTLYWCARRLGFPVRFHCGIQKSGSSLDGHAWLSLHGQAFLETTRYWEGFAVTYSYPPERATGTAPRSLSNPSSPSASTKL